MANDKITMHRFEAGNEQAWLALRNSMEDRLGGSEIGAVANHSNYSNFLKELEFRVGAKERPDISDKIAVMRGHYDEEFVADLFEKFSGKKVHRVNAIYTNADYRRLKASVDRIIYGEESGLECKTVNGFIMMKFGKDEFPRTFLDQCELYLAVTGKERWYLAILDGNNTLHLFLLTRKPEEEARWKELREKFAMVVDDNDPDAAEWKEKWAWLDAVYYVDDAELAGCEARAEHFFAKVEEVKRLMSEQKWNTEQERQVVLANIIAQVVDPSDYGEGEALDEAVADLTPIVVPDTELALAPNAPDTLHIQDLLTERKRLQVEMEEYAEARERRIGEIEAELAIKMATAEKAMLPGWKITYKMGNGRRIASVEKVETYFASKGMEIPAGIITQSEGKRSLKITEVKPKAAKKTSVPKKTAAA